MIKNAVNRLLKSKLAAMLTEYAMVAGLIAVVSIAAVASNGEQVYRVFCIAANSIAEPLKDGQGETFIPLDGCAEIYAEGDVDSNPIRLADGDVTQTPQTGFDDVRFDMNESGDNLVLYDYTLFLPGREAGTLFVDTNSITARACYQQTAGGDITCGPAGLDPSFDIPANSDQVGYLVTLPEDGTQDFRDTITMRVESSAGTVASNPFDVERTIDPTQLLAEIDFQDVVFPQFTTGAQTDMTLLPDSFNGNLTLQIDPASQPFGACVGLEGNTPSCQTPITFPTNTLFNPDNHNQVGWGTILPGDPRLPFSSDLDIILRSADNPSIARAYPITVSRTASPVIMDFSNMTFDDVIVPAGTTGLYYAMEEMVGNYGGNLRLYVNPVSSPDVQKCFERTEGSSPECVNTNVNWHVVPGDAHAIGFASSLPANEGSLYTEWEDVYSIRLISEIDLSVQHSFGDVRISRPALTNEVSPSFTFEDVTLPNSSPSLYQHVEDKTGTFSGPLRLTIRKVDQGGTANNSGIAACQDGTCSTYETSNGSSETIVVPQDAQTVGYAVQWGSQTPGQDAYVDMTITLSSQYDPSITQSWDVRVTREATPLEFTTAFTPQDVVIDAASTLEVHRINLAGDYSDSTGTDLRWTVRKIAQSSGINPTFRSCYNTNTCTSWESNLNRDENSLFDVGTTTQIGYEVNFGSVVPGRTEEWVDLQLTLTSVYDTNVSQTWTVRVSRNKTTLVFNPTFTPQNVTASATTTQEIQSFDLDGDFSNANGIDLQWKVRKVAQSSGINPSIRACQNTSLCSSWETTLNRDASRSVDLSSITEVGYAVNFGPVIPGRSEEWVDLQLTLQSQFDSSRSQTWNVRVTRTETPLVFNPTFTPQSVTTSSNTTLYNYRVTKTGDYSDGPSHDLIWKARKVAQSSNTNPSVRTCMNAGNCSSLTSTLNTTTLVTPNHDTGEIGFDINFGATSTSGVEEWADVELTLESVYGNKPSQTWTVRVTRPSN